MSELGHQLPRRPAKGAAALHPITDTKADDCRGRDGPQADTLRRDNLHRHSITSSALTKIEGGTVRPSTLAVLVFTAISNFTGT